MRGTDLSTAGWRKSSHSNSDGGECVEVSHDFDGVVPVRDSKLPHGDVLVFPAPGWAAFLTGVKSGGLSRR
ncbi:DUF397 domain-containing protein [Streptomyces sp. NPDC089424]|uniref:DUF397 domain-containing protein n=1 Tax=Streptomyces sp. NPDC089424 TaxID=3365917 RepID=UPI00382A696B